MSTNPYVLHADRLKPYLQLDQGGKVQSVSSSTLWLPARAEGLRCLRCILLGFGLIRLCFPFPLIGPNTFG